MKKLIILSLAGLMALSVQTLSAQGTTKKHQKELRRGERKMERKRLKKELKTDRMVKKEQKREARKEARLKREATPSRSKGVLGSL